VPVARLPHATGSENPGPRQLFDAFDSFVEHLAAVEWAAVALALLCHLGKVTARTRAWRNILAASYPATVVRWRGVFGAYVAGVGVNALLPARGGDVLKLYLVKHRVEGSTYPTLAAPLLVETLFDMLVAVALLAWALQLGVLPGLDVLPRLPAIDWCGCSGTRGWRPRSASARCSWGSSWGSGHRGGSPSSATASHVASRSCAFRRAICARSSPGRRSTGRFGS
jgi:hypothetical protein